MADRVEYTPPKVWAWNQENGGAWASINRPVSGTTHDKPLPIGRHPLQLYSLGTPNGVKVTVMLEELLALGHAGAEYDAWLIKIGEGDQFGSGFVSVMSYSLQVGRFKKADRTDRRFAARHTPIPMTMIATH